MIKPILHRWRDITNGPGPSGQGRRARRPYQQGDLDGLCGVYAIVNALRSLCPELDDAGATLLFDHLIQALDEAGADPSLTVAGGLTVRPLARLIQHASAYMRDAFDIAITARRLPRAVRQTTTLDVLWQALADGVTPDCVAVLCLGGRDSHWTLAIEVTPHQIRLFDSGGMGVLRRSRCAVAKAATGTVIIPAFVLFIERVGA